MISQPLCTSTGRAGYIFVFYAARSLWPRCIDLYGVIHVVRVSYDRLMITTTDPRPLQRAAIHEQTGLFVSLDYVLLITINT